MFYTLVLSKNVKEKLKNMWLLRDEFKGEEVAKLLANFYVDIWKHLRASGIS